MKPRQVVQAAQHVIYTKLVAETLENVNRIPRDQARIEYYALANALAKKMFNAGVSPLQFKAFFFKVGLYAGIKTIPVNRLIKNFTTWSFPLVFEMHSQEAMQLAVDMKHTFWLPSKDDLVKQAQGNPRLHCFLREHLEKAAAAAIQLVRQDEDAKIETFVTCLDELQKNRETSEFERCGDFLFAGFAFMKLLAETPDRRR